MPWTVNDIPDAAKNLTKPEKVEFVKIANAILEDELASGTDMKEAEAKAIRIALAQINDNKVEKNFVYSTVYESNLYKDLNGNSFTVCLKCKKEQYIEKSTGYCIDCEEPLGDAHGDLIDSENIEDLQLSYMKTINDRLLRYEILIKEMLSGKQPDLMEYISISKHHVGLQHHLFSKNNGYLASCHCIVEKFMAFEEEHEKRIWKAGFIVSDEIFEKIKDKEYQSFSFGAKGNRVLMTEELENIDE